ncbi:hypothetical protein GCM10009839_78120 [Catenulispora yoronensis]|uniref:RING-type domain-containing protein n=1 Tax=Catenulispora yoronensis TaxID=450799 RepID=A0ABP5GX47_9ACTN
MCCEHLICANCARPVSEGRCSVCRDHKERMHQGGSVSTSALTAVLLTLLVAVAFLTTTMH